MVNPVGFRFRPTEDELVDYYLRLKNLGGGSTSHIDQVISTVDICSFDPWDLPFQSRTESRDLVWYFFGRKVNKYNKGERQKRKTSSGGFWKKTGVTLDIIRKTKGNREKIGEKRVLVFHSSKLLGGSKTKWVMHEYHATFVSPNQTMPYTICKVVFKGEAREMSSYDVKEVEHSHSLIPPMNNYDGFEFTGVLDEDALDNVFNNLLSDDWNDDDDEHMKIASMH